jgi:hypothetical protein
VLDLRRLADACSDLGVCLPLLSAGDQGLPIIRRPSAAQARAQRGHAGENEPGSGVAAKVTNSGDG